MNQVTALGVLTCSEGRFLVIGKVEDKYRIVNVIARMDVAGVGDLIRCTPPIDVKLSIPYTYYEFVDPIEINLEVSNERDALSYFFRAGTGS